MLVEVKQITEYLDSNVSHRAIVELERDGLGRFKYMSGRFKRVYTNLTFPELNASINVEYICMSDGKYNMSLTDFEEFYLLNALQRF